MIDKDEEPNAINDKKEWKETVEMKLNYCFRTEDDVRCSEGYLT